MSEETSDEELMLDVKNGDTDAFERLVDRHQDWAWSIAYRFLGDASRAEDLVQDVFVKIYEAREGYEPTAQFRTYLQRILVRTCIDRDRKRKPIFTDELPDRDGIDSDPLGELVDEDVRRGIRQTMDQLSSRQRMVLILKYEYELSYREISDIMDCSEKAVESLLGRARESFKEETPDWIVKEMRSDRSKPTREEARS